MPQSQPLRIVSLLPSGTDIIAALGLEGQLVGVSHACDHRVARGKPVLTCVRMPEQATAAAIDAEVSRAAAAGESLYQLDELRLRALRPDVVLVQDICGVCAIDTVRLGAALPENARLVTLSATGLAGLFEDLVRVGEATGTTDWCREAAEELSARLAAVKAQVSGRPRPRVLALEWSDPPFTGGHWVPELIHIAGGENVLASPGEPSKRTTWAAIAEEDPDVIVFMPCGYGLEAAENEARGLLERPEVQALRAVREGRFWVTNATALFSRLTPAAGLAAETLAGILHPEVSEAPPSRTALRYQPPR